jgi:hypothetical protein
VDDQRQQTIRRAIRRPDLYLAAALVEETDDSLAALIGCPPAQVWRLRLMPWPRADQWDADVRAMATMLRADPHRLRTLLRRLTDEDDE